MEHDTITLARHATARERPEPTVMIRQPDGEARAAAQETATDRTSGDGAAMRPDPAQEPELERLGDQIAELSARIDAATYELLSQLREFDRRHGWEGWRSCAHWLNWRTGLDLGAAREKLRVAGALADLNHIAAAMARGQLSYSKVRALTRVATPATRRGCWRWRCAPPPRTWSGWYGRGGGPIGMRSRMPNRCCWRAGR